MLVALRIENYAIIEKIEIQFQNKLNIITGETGAGKSILIESLGLILGNRADTTVLKNKDKKCFVEAQFLVNKKNIKAVNQFLQNNDFDEVENELIIRREINANGKSRSFINDTPATLVQLKTITHWLVDLNQQFDTLELGNDDTQKNIIDSIAGNANLLNDYAALYLQYKTKKKELNDIQNNLNEQKRQQDYFQFLYTELENANFKPNEIEDIDEKIKLLENSSQITNLLAEINNLLDGEPSILQQLKNYAQKLNQAAKGLPNFEAIAQRLLSAQIELKDIVGDLEHHAQSVHINEEELANMNERLSLGFTLFKKHNVKTTNELLDLQNDISSKLNQISSTDEHIVKLETEIEQLQKQCYALAQNISAARQKVIPNFTQNVNQLLKKVGMPNAQLIVQCTQHNNLSNDGIDSIEFLFDANQNKPEPIGKIASGGELSRLMLIIKSFVAEKTELPTLIFDEIDTGISGEAAKQVGIIMKGLSKNIQLMAITHQPQIAALADVHYYIYKKKEANEISTHFKILSEEERVQTIAQMMSGDKPSEAALQNARELVGCL